jgi:hypothetical protein
MGKSKAGDKLLEESDGDIHTYVTREELEQLSMDMQKKLDDFAHGQIELSRQQSEATKETNRRFDQLTMLLSNQSSPQRPHRFEAGISSHQSSVHGMADNQNGNTPQSHFRPPNQPPYLQSPLGMDLNKNPPAKLTNNQPPLIPDGPPKPTTQQQPDHTAT